MVISNTEHSKYIAARFETLSYIFLSPIFFASIGLKVSLPDMTGSIILFSVLLVIVAILTKIVGCGFGAKMCKFTNHESIQIGAGMVSRGEVALIVATKGAAGTDVFGVLWPRNHHGGCHDDCRAHSVEACFP